MTVRLFDRAVAATPVTRPASRPESVPDPGYEALPRLARLRDLLTTALTARAPARWKEPPVFFFDRRRQAEFEATCPSTPADSYADLSALIAAELPDLFASVEVRRVARAIDGLRAAAEALTPGCSAARDLADLLAIPDDEVMVVLHPEQRAGFRLAVRGIADVGQFHILLADAVAGLLPGRPVAARFVAASRDVNPTIPAGVPMVAEARFQMYAPAALRPDGTLPSGMGGCKYWLWPSMPLTTVSQLNGERVILLGPPAFAATWDVSRRFPALAAEGRLLETLSPSRVVERLSRLTGRPVPSGAPHQPGVMLSKAG